MAEFDDKLNSILSNPDAMAQIMQLEMCIRDRARSPRCQECPLKQDCDTGKKR